MDLAHYMEGSNFNHFKESELPENWIQNQILGIQWVITIIIMIIIIILLL